MAEIKRRMLSTGAGEDVEKPESSYTAAGNVKWHGHCENQSGSFPSSRTQSYHVTQEFHSQISIYPREMLTYVHTRTSTRVFMVGCFSKAKRGNNPNVYHVIHKTWYSHTGILSGIKSEALRYATKWMELEDTRSRE